MTNTASSFFEQVPFASENFVANIYPDVFFLLFCLNQKINVNNELDNLCIVTELPEESDVEKILVIFRLSNDSVKSGSFCTCNKISKNIFKVTYKRVFNNRFVSEKFSQLIGVWEDIVSGTISPVEVDKVIKKQIVETFDSWQHEHFNLSKTFLENIHPHFLQLFRNHEQQEIISLYAKLQNKPITSTTLKELIKNVLFINVKVSFKNKLLQVKYHDENKDNGLGLGLGNYRLDKIVLDGIVKYYDVLAEISYTPIAETTIPFSRKPDSIDLMAIKNDDGSLKDIFIPLTNNTKENYILYQANGINIQFPSCIFSYSFQWVKGKVELLYKVQNSNTYVSENIEHNREIEFKHQLNYLLEENGKLIYTNPDEPNSIIANHTVKIIVHYENENYRIETDEQVTLLTADFYHSTLKNLLQNKIDTMFDVFLPIIYERKIDLG